MSFQCHRLVRSLNASNATALAPLEALQMAAEVYVDFLKEKTLRAGESSEDLSGGVRYLQWKWLEGAGMLPSNAEMPIDVAGAWAVDMLSPQTYRPVYDDDEQHGAPFYSWAQHALLSSVVPNEGSVFSGLVAAVDELLFASELEGKRSVATLTYANDPEAFRKAAEGAALEGHPVPLKLAKQIVAPFRDSQRAGEGVLTDMAPSVPLDAASACTDTLDRLQGGMVAHRTLQEKVAQFPDCSQWLSRSVERYLKYMWLVSRYRDLVPPIDVDVVWHAHQLSPFDYQQYCLEDVGRPVSHRVDIRDSILSEGYGRTKKLWDTHFSPEPFDPPRVIVEALRAGCGSCSSAGCVTACSDCSSGNGSGTTSEGDGAGDGGGYSNGDGGGDSSCGSGCGGCGGD